jgi:hypothetical protein
VINPKSCASLPLVEFERWRKLVEQQFGFGCFGGITTEHNWKESYDEGCIVLSEVTNGRMTLADLFAPTMRKI